MPTANPHRPRTLPRLAGHPLKKPAGVPTTGTAYARVTIASTPRRYNRDTGEWVDGDTLFLRGTAWRDLADHAAESLHKGQRVIAHGRLHQSSWETDTGEKRTAVDLDIDELGPSLRWATARVTRIARDTGPPRESGPASRVPAASPPGSDEPPF